MKSHVRKFSFMGDIVHAYTLQNNTCVLQFEDASKQVIQLTASQLEHMVSNAELIPVNGNKDERIETLALNDFRAIKRIERNGAYLKELKQYSQPCSMSARRRTINRVAERINDPHPPSPSTLFNWYKKDRNSGLGLASTFGKRHQPNRGAYCTQEVIDLAYTIFDDHFLKLNGESVSSCFTRFRNQFNENASRGISGFSGSCPSKATFFRWKDMMIPKCVEVYARQGASAGRAFKRSVMRQFKVDDILDRVEIDAVHINIGLRDEFGNIFGPVILYVIIDVHSRMILGHHLQLGSGESASGFIHCMRHAFTPKQHDNSVTTNKWPTFGIPCTIAADPSAAIQSLNLQTFVHHIKSSLVIVQAGQGWRKPFIERWFGTLRTRFLSHLPGYAGKRTDQNKAQIDMKRNATLSVNEFQSLLTKFIVDDYHQSPHTGLNGMTPHQVWCDRLLEMPIELPQSLASLRFLMGETLERTCDHQGIRVNNVFYNSIELNQLRMNLNDKNHKVTIHYDSEDISSIVVLAPSGEAIQVPAIDYEKIKGISLAQLKAIRDSGRISLLHSEDHELINDAELISALQQRHGQFLKDQTKRKKSKPRACQEQVNQTAKAREDIIEGLDERNRLIDSGFNPLDAGKDDNNIGVFDIE